MDPHLPGTDLNDPKVLSGAKRVATRRNNKARRKLEAERERLALFADQLPTTADLPVVTPEEVIQKREEARQVHAEWRVEFDALQAKHLAETKAKIAALVMPEEYAEIKAKAAACSFGERIGWDIAEMEIKRRLEPISNDALHVLLLLCNQEVDVTVDEFHRKCGDGMTREQMLKALFELQNRGFAGGGRLRYCAVRKADGAPWEATVAGKMLAGEYNS